MVNGMMVSGCCYVCKHLNTTCCSFSNGYQRSATSTLGRDTLYFWSFLLIQDLVSKAIVQTLMTDCLEIFSVRRIYHPNQELIFGEWNPTIKKKWTRTWRNCFVNCQLLLGCHVGLGRDEEINVHKSNAPQAKSFGIILQQKIIDAIARSMAVSLCATNW